MTINGLLQILLFFVLVLACTKPLGSYIATMIEGRRNWLTPVLAPVERVIYRICGSQSQPKSSTGRVMRRSAGVQRVQRWFALRDAAIARSGCHSTRRVTAQDQCQSGPGFQHCRQFYDQHKLAELRAGSDPELLRADGGLTVHNFASAAAGLAIAIALVRGFARQSVKTIGNFWVDMTRNRSVCAAADLDRRGAAVLLAGRDSESRVLTRWRQRSKA